jgi:hypothetical protein
MACAVRVAEAPSRDAIRSVMAEPRMAAMATSWK